MQIYANSFYRSLCPRASATGTVDAITATFFPALELIDQTLCAIIAAGANTSTTPTFAPSGLTAHTITTRGGAALVAGDIGPVGFVALLEYNASNTRWELLNPIASGTSSPLTTKGDLYGFSTVNARLAVGSNTQVLTADSTQTLGVKWAAPAPGGFDFYAFANFH